MAHDLQLRKGGLLITNDWDNEIFDYLEQIVDNDEIFFHFHDTICLDKNITLRDVFMLISRNTGAFSIAIGCPFLEDLVEEALSALVMKEDMDRLELSRIAFFNESEIRIYTDFIGVGKNETWAVELSPINELSYLPIVLEESIKVEDENIHLKFKMPFTLIDFVKGIVDELSFMGPPDIKAFALNELEKRNDNVMSVKTYAYEEIEKEFEEQKKKYERACDMCGGDARSQHFKKPSNLCYRCFQKIKEN